MYSEDDINSAVAAGALSEDAAASFRAHMTQVRGISRGTGGASDKAEAAAILQSELPIIPIAWYQQTLAVSDTVAGATIDPFERTFGLQDIRWAE